VGKSKYETMEEAIKHRVASLDANVADKVAQKQLESELARIDEETEQQIKEIEAAPVNKDLQLKQAEAELDSEKKANAREKTVAVQNAEYAIKQAELDVQRKKDTLAQIKEIATEREERDNLEAQQEYETILASIDNVDKTIALKVEKAKQMAKIRKKEIEIELDTIKAKNESQEEKQKCWKALYEDVKAIGLALGDGSKS